LCGHHPGWRIHRGFYADIGKHLNPAGCSALIEAAEGGDIERVSFTFRFARLVLMMDGAANELDSSPKIKTDQPVLKRGQLGCPH
jgi:hypothetical protein